MPWCEDCSKYWAPSAMTQEGNCPTCDRRARRHRSRGGGDDHGDERAPWHFKLLIAAVVIYLVWRAYQLIAG